MGHLPAGYTAHPHEDPETGELHAVSYNWLRGNRVDYTVRGTDGHIRKTVPVAGRRQPDDARLRADRELRRALRPAGGLRQAAGARVDAAGGADPGPADDVGDHRPQPAARPGHLPDRAGRGRGRHRHAAVLLGPRLPGAPRPAAARGRPGRRALVRDRPVLRVPHPERLRGRRHRRRRRGAARPDVRDRASTARTRGPRRWRGSPSTCSPTRCARTGSTTTPRSSRGSTSGSPGGDTGSATPSASRTDGPATPCSATTWPPGRPGAQPRAQAARRASSASSSTRTRRGRPREC